MTPHARCTTAVIYQILSRCLLVSVHFVRDHKAMFLFLFSTFTFLLFLFITVRIYSFPAKVCDFCSDTI